MDDIVIRFHVRLWNIEVPSRITGVNLLDRSNGRTFPANTKATVVKTDWIDRRTP